MHTLKPRHLFIAHWDAPLFNLPSFVTEVFIAPRSTIQFELDA
jgi:hypothetical protein